MPTAQRQAECEERITQSKKQQLYLPGSLGEDVWFLSTSPRPKIPQKDVDWYPIHTRQLPVPFALAAGLPANRLGPQECYFDHDTTHISNDNALPPILDKDTYKDHSNDKTLLPFKTLLSLGTLSETNTHKLHSDVKYTHKLHSNVKYTEEENDFIRCMHEDREMSWSSVRDSFQSQFGWRENKNTVGCFTSIYYRQNSVPMIKVVPETDAWELVLQDDRRLSSVLVKVRGRRGDRSPDAGADTNRATLLGVDTWLYALSPTTLVEKHPHRVLQWEWTTAEEKMAAVAVCLEDRKDEDNGCLSVKGKWRKVIREAETYPAREIVYKLGDDINKGRQVQVL